MFKGILQEDIEALENEIKRQDTLEKARYEESIRLEEIRIKEDICATLSKYNFDVNNKNITKVAEILSVLTDGGFYDDIYAENAFTVKKIPANKLSKKLYPDLEEKDGFLISVKMLDLV